MLVFGDLIPVGVSLGSKVVVGAMGWPPWFDGPLLTHSVVQHSGCWRFLLYCQALAGLSLRVFGPSAMFLVCLLGGCHLRTYGSGGALWLLSCYGSVTQEQYLFLYQVGFPFYIAWSLITAKRKIQKVKTLTVLRYSLLYHQFTYNQAKLNC